MSIAVVAAAIVVEMRRSTMHWMMPLGVSVWVSSLLCAPVGALAAMIPTSLIAAYALVPPSLIILDSFSFSKIRSDDLIGSLRIGRVTVNFRRTTAIQGGNAPAHCKDIREIVPCRACR